MKKLILLFAAILMASTGLWAETQNVSYRYPVYNTDGDPASGIREWKTASVDATIVTRATTPVTWGTVGTATWYVVTDANVGLSKGAICAGEVHLILDFLSSLTVTGEDLHAGIEVSGGNSLTIYGGASGSGQLIANGGRGSAGIGGGFNCSDSNITINGGTVTATGDYAAGIGSSEDGEESNNIFVSDFAKVIADGNVIAHTSSDDIAPVLAGKKNVTVLDFLPLLIAIDQAVGSPTDATITGIANTAKASIFEQTTADGAKQVSDLAVEKINATKDILTLIGDDTNVRNTEFISEIISYIVSAVSVNEVTKMTTRTANEIPAFLKGRSSAVGTLGTKQDGPVLIVTDKDDKEIILYSPKSVEYIKVKEK